MKILQVVPYFYPAVAYGGPGKLVYDISTTLAGLGNQVTVYTSDAFDKKGRMPSSKQIRTVRDLDVRYFKNISNALAFSSNILSTPLALFFQSLHWEGKGLFDTPSILPGFFNTTFLKYPGNFLGGRQKISGNCTPVISPTCSHGISWEKKNRPNKNEIPSVLKNSYSPKKFFLAKFPRGYNGVPQRAL